MSVLKATLIVALMTAAAGAASGAIQSEPI